MSNRYVLPLAGSSLLAVLLTLVTVTSAGRGGSTTSATEDGPASRAHLSSQLRDPAIDGDITPELVPDIVAWRHFVMATAQPADPTQSARRNAYVGLIGLSTEDTRALLSAVSEVRAELDTIAEDARKLTFESNTPVARQLLKSRKDAVFEEAMHRVQSSLTTKGRADVETFVQDRVKRRAKIYQ